MATKKTVPAISNWMENEILCHLDQRRKDVTRMEGMAFGFENLQFHFKPFADYVTKVRQDQRTYLRSKGVSPREIRTVYKPNLIKQFETEVAEIEEKWKKGARGKECRNGEI